MCVCFSVWAEQQACSKQSHDIVPAEPFIWGRLAGRQEHQVSPLHPALWSKQCMDVRPGKDLSVKENKDWAQRVPHMWLTILACVYVCVFYRVWEMSAISGRNRCWKCEKWWLNSCYGGAVLFFTWDEFVSRFFFSSAVYIRHILCLNKIFFSLEHYVHIYHIHTQNIICSQNVFSTCHLGFDAVGLSGLMWDTNYFKEEGKNRNLWVLSWLLLLLFF